MGLSISNQLLGSTGLSVGLGLSRGNGLYFGGFGGGAPFTPAALFASGEQGVWYDPSDFSTLFQDSAGTIPVTAVEQPVGLMLDLSKGLVLGSELVTNGTFDSGTTGWSASPDNAGTPTFTAVSGTGRITAVDGNAGWNQGVTTVVGLWYQVTGTANIISGTPTAIRVRKQDNTTTGSATNAVSIVTAAGTVTGYFLATATTSYIQLQANIVSGTTVVAFDNITVKSIAGNHATQSTSTARPVVSARVNLLEKTEDLANAYWAAGGITSRVTASGFTTITENTSAGTHLVNKNAVFTNAVGVSVTTVVSFKAGTRRYVLFGWDNNTTGVAVVVDTQNWTVAPIGTGTITASSITNLGSGEYQVSVTGFVSSGTTTVNSTIYGASDAAGTVSYTGTGATIIASKIDLRVANDTALPAYQRVNTATDYNATGFPYYLQFDNVGGTNKSMATANIDFTATDAMSVFAGVRKLSDATRCSVVELGTAVSSGYFHLEAPRTAGTGNYVFRSAGDPVTALADAIAATYAAPITNVLAGLSDISADTCILRVNGVQAASSSSDQGTGNYGNYPLYIGARAGTSLFLNGRIYSLIVRGAATSETQIGQTEQWISNEMGGGYYPTGFEFLVTADGDQLTDASGNPLYTQPLYL